MIFRSKPLWFVLALVVAWRNRRSVPGLLLHLIILQLPRVALAKLRNRILGSPSNDPLNKLDILSASAINSLRWLLEGTHSDIRSLITFNCWLDGYKARNWPNGGAYMRHVDSEGVKGVWVAESEANLPVAHGRMSQDTVVLFFIHGGGYMLNTCDYGAPHHLLLCKAFNENAKRVNSNKRLIVFSLEYGLAPRHVFPSQVHEAGIAYDWLVTKCGAQHVVVGGDSAGAHCAISLLNHIAETPALAKLPIQPFASVLFSPWINPLMTELPTYRTFDIISLNSVKYGSAVAFGRPTLENVKRINLLENDPNDFNLASNGTLIIYGGVEILADVIDEFGKRLQSRKKPGYVKVHRFDGMPHDFNMVFVESMFKSIHPHAMKAIKITAEFIQETLVK